MHEKLIKIQFDLEKIALYISSISMASKHAMQFNLLCRVTFTFSSRNNLSLDPERNGCLGGVGGEGVIVVTIANYAETKILILINA